MKHELTPEEQLTLENLRLKIQIAEMQKQQVTVQLGTFTVGLLKKHDVPETSGVSLSGSHLIVLEKPTEAPPATRTDAETETTDTTSEEGEAA